MLLRSAGLPLLFILGLLAAPLAAEAQQAGKVWRIGYLASDPATTSHLADSFRQGLRELGWVEGRDIIIEYRWTRGDVGRLPQLITELVRLRVDLIVAPTAAYAEAAKQSTSTIPIVFVVHGDPVGAGHVASLAHPGGNLTGLAQMTTELNAKGLELLHEAVPGVSRVAVLWEPGIPAPVLTAIKGRSQTLGLRLELLAVRSAVDLNGAFAAMTRERVGALLVLSGSVAFLERDRLAHLATQHQLPTMFTQREHAEAGGLMSYGANLAHLFRRAATYVDKILKGAKPADLPVEQPTKFELVINMKTAKALGLTIPPSLLLRADEVIQ